MLKYLVTFDSEECPVLIVDRQNAVTGEPFSSIRLRAVVAEFDGDEHLRFQFAQPLTQLYITSYMPRDPEKRAAEHRGYMFVHRDRVVSISPFRNGAAQ